MPHNLGGLTPADSNPTAITEAAFEPPFCRKAVARLQQTKQAKPCQSIGGGSTLMPIGPLLADEPQLAADAPVLIAAFEDTLKALGLVDRDDPLTLTVANHIIAFAKAGERDPKRLCDLTLQAIRSD